MPSRFLLAPTTIATAFQRMMLRIFRSIVDVAGVLGLFVSTSMVFM